MIVETKELIGALKAAAMFASTDETRPHMNAVHLEAVDGKALRLVATDGHTLWCCEISARETSADPAPAAQPSWNVPLADVHALLKALRDGDGPESTVLLGAREVDGIPRGSAADHFPPYTQLMPAVTTTIPGKVIPEFATNYVARACEALAFYGKGLAPELPKTGSKHEKDMARAKRDQFLTPPVAWAISGEYDPALFYSPKFPAALCIVMPRKGESPEAASIDAFVTRVRSGGRKAKAA